MALTREELAPALERIAAPVAVTGASGFVGSHLAEALVAGGVQVRVLVRDRARLLPALGDRVEIVDGDLDDQRALHRLAEGAGVLIHAAGRVRASAAAQFDRANRQGTENLVAACAAVGARPRLVYLSSLAATGPSGDPAGRRPDEPPAPISAYGRSKLGGEEAVRRYPGAWTILRPPAIYGPRDIDVFQFFRLAARGAVPIPAGARWVTLAQVTDVVRAIMAAAAGAGAGAVLHLGEPTPYRMDELITMLAAAGGVQVRVLHVPGFLLRAAGYGGDVLQRLGARDLALTSDKVRELMAFHWSARTAESLVALGLSGYVPFSSGARAAWAWYREQGWVAHAKIPQV
ncbi:MAG: NAD-dependent epimerase/dehydratase family protein [Acidobacteriota bacterium]